MKGYKGFNKNFTCLDKKYEVGENYSEDKVELCESGMHFCENPIDCLEYYNPIYHSRYCQVTADNVSPEVDNTFSGDSKRVCGTLQIDKEIGITDIIKDGIEYIREKSIFENNTLADPRKFLYLESKFNFDDNMLPFAYKEQFQLAVSAKFMSASMMAYHSKIVSSGDCNSLSASGDEDVLISSGSSTQLAIAGDSSEMITAARRNKSASSGLCAKITSFGHLSYLASSGDRNMILSYGLGSNVASSGEGNHVKINANLNKVAISGGNNIIYSKGEANVIACSGISNVVEMKGEHNICCMLGRDSICKGSLGDFIGLVEWEFVDGMSIPVDAKFFKVDGEKIKPDVFYELKNGEPVECHGADLKIERFEEM